MIRRIPITLACMFLSGVIAFAQPPKLEIEALIEARGDYVTFSPDTDAITVAYIGRSGIDPFPSEMLKDGKSFILPVRGLKEGDYQFSAIAIKQNEYTRRDFTIRIGKAQPAPLPPTPDPPQPKPDPKLDDAPVQTNGLHVIFVYETGKQLTQNQFNTLYGAATRNYLDTVCDRYNSQPQWRVLDRNSQSLVEPWKDVIKRAKTGIPGLVIIVGKKYVYEGDVPATPDETVKLIDKYKPKTRTDYCPNCPEPYKFYYSALDKK